MRSRFSEAPDDFTAYGKNSFTFNVLLDHPADIEIIRSELWQYGTRNKIICDGLIFYHREAPYISGQTPLVTWLRPFMLPEKLNIRIPLEYERKRPPNYVNLETYLKYFAEKRKKQAQIEQVCNQLLFAFNFFFANKL